MCSFVTAVVLQGNFPSLDVILSCPIDRPLQRYGRGDGSKLLCRIRDAREGSPCVIYSVGNHGKFAHIHFTVAMQHVVVWCGMQCNTSLQFVWYAIARAAQSAPLQPMSGRTCCACTRLAQSYARQGKIPGFMHMRAWAASAPHMPVP